MKGKGKKAVSARTLFYVAGVLMVVAGIAQILTDSGVGAALIAVGVVFLGLGSTQRGGKGDDDAR